MTRYFKDSGDNYFSYNGVWWKEAKVTYHKDDLVWKFKVMSGWAGRGRPEDKPHLIEISRPDLIDNVLVID